MRIVLVSLARRGGMVHFLAELANALVALTPTWVVISTAAERTLFSNNVGSVRVDTGKNQLQGFAQALNPFVWWKLCRRLEAARADVIHIVGVHPWHPAVAALSKLLGKPLIYTVHDPNPHPGAPLTMRAADWATARMADELIALTRHGQMQLLQRASRRVPSA